MLDQLELNYRRQLPQYAMSYDLNGIEHRSRFHHHSERKQSDQTILPSRDM